VSQVVNRKYIKNKWIGALIIQEKGIIKQYFRVVVLVDSDYCLILFGKDVKGRYTPWNLVKILDLDVTLPIQTNLNKIFI